MIEKKRNDYVDYLKGICILFVLLGHCFEYGNGVAFLSNGLYWDNPLMKTIYTFHMPLFIAINGYLFYTSFVKYGAMQVCVRRFKKTTLSNHSVGWVFNN